MLSALFKVRALRRLYPWVSSFFKDERLRVALSFQSMYLGMSPFDGPALYALLPFTELGLGLYFPMGGMQAIAQALARLARELGVSIRCNTEVVHVQREGPRVVGVRLAGGALERADVVVINADLPYAYRKLLDEPHPRQEQFKYTGSAFLMHLGVRRTYPKLLHHNLYVPRDFRRSMDAVFREPRIPDDPAYYICNPNKTDPSLAPPGHENLMVLVPTAHEVEAIDWEREGPRFQEAMLERLERLGLTRLRESIVCARVFTPRDLRIHWNAERGAAFGLAHGLDQIGYLRPHNRHATLRNLYFVGASTHPGTGVPMVLISGKLVAERIALEQPWLPAASAVAPPLRQEAA
jgi:phytoene desaturase